MKTMTADEGGGKVYHIPAPRGFEDTGFVRHKFGSGSSIEVRVVPSMDYSQGADIKIVIKDGKDHVCTDLVMEKFAALCLADAIINNLVKQEELVYDNIRKQIRDTRSGGS